MDDKPKLFAPYDRSAAPPELTRADALTLSPEEAAVLARALGLWAASEREDVAGAMLKNGLFRLLPDDRALSVLVAKVARWGQGDLVPSGEERAALAGCAETWGPEAARALELRLRRERGL